LEARRGIHSGSSFVAAFLGVAIAIHFATVERAALLDAEHVAELMSTPQ